MTTRTLKSKFELVAMLKMRPRNTTLQMRMVAAFMLVLLKVDPLTKQDATGFCYCLLGNGRLHLDSLNV